MADHLRFAEIHTRRRRLPHWESPDAIYFLTYRLADALPRRLLEDWHEKQTNEQSRSTAAKREQIKRVEAALDAGHGSCFLARPEVARIVVENLRHFEPERYRLLAWCVMPNHVHVVLHLSEGESLARVVLPWKSFTARRANAILGRRGPFWQREYFDRIIRNPEHLGRAVRYVRDNPSKARLKDWPWVWVRDDLREW